MLNYTAWIYIKYRTSHSDSVQKLPTNARRLVKCPTNSSTVTDYYNSNCQSNPINSTLDIATAVHKFQQASVSQNKLPTLQNFLLVSKHSRKHIHGTLSNIKNRKTLAVDRTLTKRPSLKICCPYNSNIRECI